MNKILGVNMECKLPFEKVKRRIIVKKGATTDPNLGCEPNRRSVEDLVKYGVININKSSGPTRMW